jgi:hypothetical protein
MRIAVRPVHWINFNTALIQFMQHGGTNTVFVQRLFVALVFMKPEATSTRFEKLFAGHEANSP